MTGGRFDIVHCDACGMAATSPVPPDLRPYYPSEWYGGQQRFRQGIDRTLGMFYRARASKVEDAVRRLIPLGPSPAVLDVGCGRGLTLAALRDRGWRVTGCELSEMAAAWGRGNLGLDIRTELLHEGMFEAGTFDVITLWHSLEHMVSPREVLQFCRHWLRPGGVLFVAVPNYGSLQARVGGPLWFHLDPPRHLHHFTQAHLTRLLQTFGFQAREWAWFSLMYDVYSWMQTVLNRMGFPNALLYRFLMARARLTAPQTALALLSLGVGVPIGIVSLVASLCGANSTMEVFAVQTEKS
jgi:2-polyprenyl-3-methyl-5-hydroxy-6-metoxy-1,4-benzoquinol methylase